MSATELDLIVIGGGVNGAGIARDAAGRGLSVVLCEQGDLGGVTSSAHSEADVGPTLEAFEGTIRELIADRRIGRH